MKRIHEGKLIQSMLAVCCVGIIAFSVNTPLIADRFFSGSLEPQAVLNAPAQVPAQAHCAGPRMQKAARATRAHSSPVHGLPAQAERFGAQSGVFGELERMQSSFLSVSLSPYQRDRAPPSR